MPTQDLIDTMTGAPTGPAPDSSEHPPADAVVWRAALERNLVVLDEHLDLLTCEELHDLVGAARTIAAAVQERIRDCDFRC
jgi:hypothetical protein